jgi:hypothetical protein
VDRDIIRVEIVQRKTTSRERVAIWAPIFISLVALILAIWSAWETREHDKLSVMPDVGFVVQADPAATWSGFSIENNGLGPAKISDQRVYLDGKRVAWADIRPMAKALLRPDGIVTVDDFPGEITLRSGDTLRLFYAPNKDIAERPQFAALIYRRVFAILRVCSMYEDCWLVCSTTDNDKCAGEEQKFLTAARASLPK